MHNLMVVLEAATSSTLVRKHIPRLCFSLKLLVLQPVSLARFSLLPSSALSLKANLLFSKSDSALWLLIFSLAYLTKQKIITNTFLWQNAFSPLVAFPLLMCYSDSFDFQYPRIVYRYFFFFSCFVLIYTGVMDKVEYTAKPRGNDLTLQSSELFAISEIKWISCLNTLVWFKYPTGGLWRCI